ncbi:MAG: hypothetical protein COU65_01640 [Candidatus Pacebacteria bacterium CG10_big_fil_rev_8_21_14_0_10_42_12]|nr:hypothetical protein [Candidatus Paceibacterota bacterium]PIR62779.1 MAG: hypothetical protein COU65_01640 [Candidatus Pacebacteria bacterium CG10_big_fil_rev_8_21_14_0_10_42_12]
MSSTLELNEDGQSQECNDEMDLSRRRVVALGTGLLAIFVGSSICFTAIELSDYLRRKKVIEEFAKQLKLIVDDIFSEKNKSNFSYDKNVFYIQPYNTQDVKINIRGSFITVYYAAENQGQWFWYEQFTTSLNNHPTILMQLKRLVELYLKRIESDLEDKEA